MGGFLRIGWGALRLPARLRKHLPPAVRQVMERLTQASIPCWIVGGAVRDLLLGQQPKDWDLAVKAEPDAVTQVMGRTVPARAGTLILPLGPGEAVQITSLRGPDLLTDLGRRDFTIGAMALTASGRLIDPYGGRRDLARRIMRATGEPGARFAEDPIRLLRAVRLAAELQGRIEPATADAIRQQADLLGPMAPERKRDELSKLLLSPWPAWGLEELRRLGLLRHLAPELEEGAGLEQNRYHAYDVWTHTILTVAHAPAVLHLRLAALLHDVAKPRCLSVDQAGERHFYSHELVGADMAAEILTRLRFDNETRRRTVHLVRYHMDLHLDLAMTDRAIMRMVRRIGREHMADLIALRRADRMANGTKPGELGEGTLFLLQRIEELEREAQAFTTRDLAVSGHDVMAALELAPGPQVGAALERLLTAVQEGGVPNEKGALLAWLRQGARGTDG